MNRKVTISDTKITKRHIELVNNVLKSGRLTYGPMSKKFENKWAKLHDRKYAIFCNSGTSALQVSIHAMKIKYGWKDGAEVIVPTITFPATINSVIHNNLKPVFADVRLRHFDIDPKRISENINYKTVAIIPVDMFGESCRMPDIMEIAKKNDLKVIEDACETAIVNCLRKPVGSMSDVSCFSTYFSHIVSTGVGGFVTTNDDDLALIIKSLIYHGRDQIYLKMDDDNVPKENLFSVVQRRFSFKYIGYSFRATELEAALGLAELERAKDMLEKRKRNAELYTQLLKPLGKFLLPRPRYSSEHAWMFYPILLKQQYEKSRNKLVRFLEENGIETRYLMPITNQPVYKDFFLTKSYPVAERINRAGFLIGCHPFLSKNDILYAADKMEEFFNA